MQYPNIKKTTDIKKLIVKKMDTVTLELLTFSFFPAQKKKHQKVRKKAHVHNQATQIINSSTVQ